MNGEQIARAVAAFMPLLKILITEAEGTGATGREKHEAVSGAAESLYRGLQQQGGIREIKEVPWEIVAPLLVPFSTGLISILVGLWNRLWGKAWGALMGLLSSEESVDA